LTGEELGALEPELQGRFSRALYFASEAHLDPRAALTALAQRLLQLGVSIRFGVEASPALTAGRAVIDCSGLAARGVFADLRGVKGEMLLLSLPELSLRRPVRVLHPRLPVYVVPRGGGEYMVGASMIESDEGTRISARSMLELLSAAYALHPAFGEARIVEIGTGVRAAFPDNLPRIRRVGDALYVNGLYRHGFLLAPALARRAAQMLLNGQHFPEVTDEDPRQRRLA
jgi:glycine oxidase